MTQAPKPSRLVGALAVALAGALALAGPFCEVALGKRKAPRFQKIREERFPAFILAFDLAPKSDLAAVALSDGRVHIWRIETGETVRDLTFPAPDSEIRDDIRNVEPIRARFSPDGKTLGVSHLSRIYLYDAADWRQVASLGVEGEDAVRPRLLPTLKPRPLHAEERKTKTYDEMARDYLKRMASGDGGTRITDFAFAPDGSAILAAYCRGACFDRPGWYNIYHDSGNDPVRFWELPTGRLVWERVYGSDVVVGRVVPSPDGKLFAAANKQPGWSTVQIHDLKTGKRLYSLPGVQYFPDPAPSIRFTPDSRYVITYRVGPTTKKSRPWEHLAMYDVRDGNKVAEIPDRIGAYDSDISPDGQWLATPTLHGWTFQVYDVKTRRRVALVKQFPWGWTGPPLDRVRFDPDGQYLVVANRELGRLAVYRIGPD